MTADYPLRLAVFDLDYTVWKPEMYQIYGPPRQKTTKGSKTVVTDRCGTEIEIFDGADHALVHINDLRENHGMDIEAAVASRTDEPEWAQQCMDWLIVGDGTNLTSCFAHVEIDFGDKKLHFRNLHKKTGIPYESMVFFDNEMRNITSVQKLGVKCIYTPDGMTRDAWEEALEAFGMTSH